MSTHRVIVDLPAGSYEELRRLVNSGVYSSESDAVADALEALSLNEELDRIDPVSTLSPELCEEFCAAYDEDVANPGAALTPAELDASLQRERLRFAKAG